MTRHYRAYNLTRQHKQTIHLEYEEAWHVNQQLVFHQAHLKVKHNNIYNITYI